MYKKWILTRIDFNIYIYKTRSLSRFTPFHPLNESPYSKLSHKFPTMSHHISDEPWWANTFPAWATTLSNIIQATRSPTEPPFPQLCHFIPTWAPTFPTWANNILSSNVSYPQLGIGIEKTNAGIGIPASRILVRYRTKKCWTVSA